MSDIFKELKDKLGAGYDGMIKMTGERFVFEHYDTDGHKFRITIEYGGMAEYGCYTKCDCYNILFKRLVDYNDNSIKIETVWIPEKAKRSVVIGHLSNVIVQWVSATRNKVKKPINTKDAQNDIYEQKYWECQRRIDEYEREREETDKLIAQYDDILGKYASLNFKLLSKFGELIDTDSKLDKLETDLDKEKERHRKATDICKSQAQEIETLKSQLTRLRERYAWKVCDDSEARKAVDKALTAIELDYSPDSLAVYQLVTKIKDILEESTKD